MSESGKNPHAVALGKLGAAQGGRARWARMTPAERAAHIARMNAARTRRPYPEPPLPESETLTTSAG